MLVVYILDFPIINDSKISTTRSTNLGSWYLLVSYDFVSSELGRKQHKYYSELGRKQHKYYISDKV